jgi:predicted enzyme related to lactoylglutathione lyase
MFNGDCKLAALWLYSKDPEKAAKFCRDALGMKQVKHQGTNSFDGGGLRLSIHPLAKGMNKAPNGECFLVFFVREGIERKMQELKDKGVDIVSVDDEPYGQTVQTKDPDGHDLFLWQPPSKKSKKYENVATVVEHYERIFSKLE